MSYEDDVTAVRRALLRRYKDSTDVGEFLVDAVVRAENQLRNDKEDAWAFGSLTDNRPGSWEAALLRNMIESGGG